MIRAVVARLRGLAHNEVAPGSAATATDNRPSTAHGSATVAFWTLISRATGVARVVTVGAVLGPTFFANAFLSANTIPQITFYAVMGTILSPVIVPAVVQSLHEDGPRGAAGLIGRVTGFLLAGSSAVAACIALVSPLLAWTLTLGIPESERAHARTLTTLMLLFVAPQVVLYTVATVGAAVQQAQGRFALAAAAPAVENLGLVVTMLAAGLLYETGLEIGRVPLGLVLLLGAGATASVALHAGVQVLGSARVGVAIRPQRGWRSERATQELVRRLRASIVVAACPSLSAYALLAVAATMPGGVVVLQMALQVFQLPLALGARAVSTAALPAMSDAASRRDTPAFAAAWRQALHYVVLAALPPLFLLIAFATAIAHTLATGQSGSAAVISSLATCIVVLAVAQLPAGLHEVGRQALFARLDVRGPRLAAGAHLAATVVLALLAALVPAGTPRLAGIAAATLVAEAVACVLVLQRIRRAISPERIADGRKLTAAGVGAMTMLPVVGAGWVLVGDGDEPLVDVPISLAIGALAVTLFAVSTMRLNRLA